VLDKLAGFCWSWDACHEQKWGRIAPTDDADYLSPCGRERIFLALAQLTLRKSKRGDLPEYTAKLSPLLRFWHLARAKMPKSLSPPQGGDKGGVAHGSASSWSVNHKKTLPTRGRIRSRSGPRRPLEKQRLFGERRSKPFRQTWC
jgi:hypothetical protein